MPTIRVFQRSFSGGEVSPEFFGQLEDGKYQTGAATMRNFIALPHGPASNRSGFAYVAAVKNNGIATRLIPFSYSTNQTFAIELGAGYFRFHTNGATLMNGSVPFEVANSYAAADIMDIHYVQSADVMTLVHPNYPPMLLQRLGALSWTFTAALFAPDLSPPTNVTAVPTLASSPTNLRSYLYLVTSVGSKGVDESPVSNICMSPNVLISGISTATTAVITTPAAHGLVVGQKVDISGVVGMTQINATGYTVNSVPSTTTFTLLGSSGIVNSSGWGAYTSGGTITVYGIVNNLLQTGAFNTIFWNAVAGITLYNIYLYSNGLYGFIGQTAGTNFVDNNIVPDVAQTPPVNSNPFSGTGNYPGAVSYFQQRKCFAGTGNAPQNMWMTRSGTESNMNYSLPSRADDSVSFQIAARDVNTIRHIVPMANLLLLTNSAEWKVNGANSDVVTPSNVSVLPQAYTGANNVTPLIVNNNVIFAAARGGHVREMSYAWQANGYLSNDLSLRASHLFDTFQIVDMAYAKSPFPIAWMVSSNGDLLGFTYVPEQQIGAWHRHDTGISDTFQACCVVTEADEDALYVITNRNINGTQQQFVERLSSHFYPTPSKPTDATNAFFVDCGSTYNGAATSTISGLSYLNGMTVNVLADGAVHPQCVVTGGSITLQQPASVVQVGLPIQADLQTLPVVGYMDMAFGEGRFKNINKAVIRVSNSRGLFAGPDQNTLTEAKERTVENYGSPPNLISDDMDVVVTGNWGFNGQLFIRQNDPLPLTVVGVTLEVAVGG